MKKYLKQHKKKLNKTNKILKLKTFYIYPKSKKWNTTILCMCHGLYLQCHHQPYRDVLPLLEINEAHDFGILRNAH